MAAALVFAALGPSFEPRARELNIISHAGFFFRWWARSVAGKAK